MMTATWFWCSLCLIAWIHNRSIRSDAFSNNPSSNRIQRIIVRSCCAQPAGIIIRPRVGRHVRNVWHQRNHRQPLAINTFRFGNVIHVKSEPSIALCLVPPTSTLSETDDDDDNNDVDATTTLRMNKLDRNELDGYDSFQFETTLAVIGGESVLIVLAVILSWFLGTPNYGFGPGWLSFISSFDTVLTSIGWGFLWSIPLGIVAWILDFVENQFPALQDVSTATQRSVISLLGISFKPVLGLLTAIGLGLSAGFGEEMLFRGIFQYEITTRLGTGLGIFLPSIVFALLHSVTPLYATLSGIASVYFGIIYWLTGNLAIAISCHTIYDVGALLYAHWFVSRLSKEECLAIVNWQGPESG